MTRPHQSSHERLPAEERSEIFRRINVINIATDGEHASEFASHPDLFQSQITEQHDAAPVQATADKIDVVPTGSAAIDLATRRDAQEERDLADLRQRIDQLAA